MPLDPSIILRGANQVQMQDPLERYGKSLALKNLMQQGDIQSRAIEDEDAQRSALRESGGDRSVYRRLLGERGQHKAIEGLDKFDLEKRAKEASIGKDDAAAGKSRYDVDIGKLQHGAALLSSAKDPASFDAALRVGLMTGTFTPEVVAKAKEQGYSPQLVSTWSNAGLTRAQQLEDERKRQEHDLKAANEPFLPGPNGPVAQVPVQAFQLDKAKKAAPNVTVKTDVKTGESLAGQVGPMMAASVIQAEGAVKQVAAAQRIVRAVDEGKIFAGPLANQRVTLAQAQQVLGIGGKDEAEKVANTRAAIRGLAELTLQGRQQMKGQGAITESEGLLAQKAMSGSIEDLTVPEIRQLARASERAARFNHNEHVRKLKVMQDNPEIQQLAPFYQGPAIAPEIADPAPGPAGAAPSAVRAQADAILGAGGRR